MSFLEAWRSSAKNRPPTDLLWFSELAAAFLAATCPERVQPLHIALSVHPPPACMKGRTVTGPVPLVFLFFHRHNQGRGRRGSGTERENIQTTAPSAGHRPPLSQRLGPGQWEHGRGCNSSAWVRNARMGHSRPWQPACVQDTSQMCADGERLKSGELWKASSCHNRPGYSGEPV